MFAAEYNDENEPLMFSEVTAEAGLKEAKEQVRVEGVG